MHPLLRRIVLLYPWVSRSPPLTAIAVLGVGIWFASWSLVCVGAVSLLYQSWGAAYKRMAVSPSQTTAYTHPVDGRYN